MPVVPAERPPTAGCRAPAGVSTAPQTIAEVVTLVNALPKPLTLGCFLESLARPLAAQATYSLFSAQPALGSRSPRIFLLQGPLTMSIVPAGEGAALLEFGEQRTVYYSLKGEIVFPVTAALPPTTPFEGLLVDGKLTRCGVCHAEEKPDPTISNVQAFTSLALRPLSRDRVTLASLQQELAICDPKVEPGRCSILDGLLGWGAVAEHEFPPEMSTFGGQ